MSLQFGGVEHLRCFLLNRNNERCEEENLSFSICFFLFQIFYFPPVSQKTFSVKFPFPRGSSVISPSAFLSAGPRSLLSPGPSAAVSTRSLKGEAVGESKGIFHSPRSPGGARRTCGTAQPASRSISLSLEISYTRGEDSRKLESFVEGQSHHSRGNSCLWPAFQRIREKQGRSQPGASPSPK